MPLLAAIELRRQRPLTRVLCVGRIPAWLAESPSHCTVSAAVAAEQLPTEGPAFDLVVFADRWWRPALASGTSDESTVFAYIGAARPALPHGDIYTRIRLHGYAVLMPHPIGLLIERTVQEVAAGTVPPSELCEIMSRQRSDKGSGWHNYTLLYHRLFSRMRGARPRVFELGIGTNDVQIPSNMGPDGRPGASLFGWSEYFGADARIAGGDIDEKIRIDHPQIRTVVVDQRSPDSIRAAFATLPAPAEFDLIVEDGLHEYEANETFLLNSWAYLSPNGGIYVIEDVRGDELPRMAQFVERLKDRVALARIVQLHHPGNAIDNNVVILVKEADSATSLAV